MRIEVQDAVCAFVRDIISARTGEEIWITAWPDRDERNARAPDELWESRTRRYVVEHTRVEAFEGQIANQERIFRMLVPVKDALADRLPGYFVLSVREAETSVARVNLKAARIEIERLVLEAAASLPVGQVVTLRSSRLPFTLQLYLRHKDRSNLVLYTDIEGDPETVRLERIRRALEAKCPMLKERSVADNRVSVLAIESNDLQLSNALVISAAVIRALKERNDRPDVAVLVETDIAPMNGWMLKEGARYGRDVPMLNGGYCYIEGQIRR